MQIKFIEQKGALLFQEKMNSVSFLPSRSLLSLHSSGDPTRSFNLLSLTQQPGVSGAREDGEITGAGELRVYQMSLTFPAIYQKQKKERAKISAPQGLFTYKRQ